LNKEAVNAIAGSRGFNHAGRPAQGEAMSTDDLNDQGSREALPAISHIMRREIQAPIAACLIRGFAQVFGRDRAMEAAIAAIRADAFETGRVMALKYGSNSMRDLGRVVREIWAADNAIVIRILEESEKKLSFDVIRCGYVEIFDAMGMKDLGFCLSCSRDGSFASGFNPRIRMARSGTIMKGAAHCDFRFTLE
jgi:hypothetical protein